MPIDLDSLADAVTATDRPHGRFGVRCKTCQLLLELPPVGVDPRADMIRDRIDGGTEAEVVARQLTAGGAPIGPDSIRRHRRGRCLTKRVVAGR